MHDVCTALIICPLQSTQRCRTRYPKDTLPHPMKSNTGRKALPAAVKLELTYTRETDTIHTKDSAAEIDYD